MMEGEAMAEVSTTLENQKNKSKFIEEMVAILRVMLEIMKGEEVMAGVARRVEELAGIRTL